NPKTILSKRFSVDRPDAETAPIVLKDVEFYSTCEHHMLPFFGEISVGYLPGCQNPLRPYPP
ncbi:MAG: GTP cyclohydrolase I, partial [Thermoguttaceae bacterium]|nr:GTP cyclohydrolase I [Thermoguttaceae bacterium]